VTLIVSLLSPDGIVLAGDSLATIETFNMVEGRVDVVCPNCQHAHSADAFVQGANIPATSFPNAQKLFPFLKMFGMGTAGAAQLNGMSISFIVRQLEQESMAVTTSRPATVSQFAGIVSDRALRLLHEEARTTGFDPASVPDEYLQFQIVGYDDDKSPWRIAVSIGSTIESKEINNTGAYAIGVTDVVDALWSAREDSPLFQSFSLQDAVEYAEFLIAATASHQRFYGTLPSVGSAIDIALITPFDGFRWIRQKPFFAAVTGGSNGTIEA
jgi:hypothetical protein